MIVAVARDLSPRRPWLSGGVRSQIAIRTLCLCLVIMAHASGSVREAKAFAPDARTDANIITAVDVSDSIGRHEEWLQQTGLVRALLDPRFLDAATAGPQRQIGFAVFAWSSNDRFDILVPWTIIASREDAARISATLSSLTLIDRSSHGGGDDEDARGDNDDVAASLGRLTDISGAIDYASQLLASAPFTTNRSVMNICANGVDNVTDAGEDGTRRARDRALAQDMTINAVALEDSTDLVHYFRSNVIGGSASFVITMASPDTAADIMVEKLQRELLIALGALAP